MINPIAVNKYLLLHYYYYYYYYYYICVTIYTYIAQLVSSLSALFARDPCKPHLTSTMCPI